MSNKTILVTGSAGMTGCYLVKDLIAKGCIIVGVDRRVSDWTYEYLKQVALDLADKSVLEALLDVEKVDRCIHLAVLVHAGGGETDSSFERFKFLNVICAENVFEACVSHNVPVLFISTVDAISMVKGSINSGTELNPTSNYGKSKVMVEGRLKEICPKWNIYRSSPVYTATQKCNVERRYYLKYLNWAHEIGNGGKFEVPEMSGAVKAMVDWVDKEADNTIHIIKNPELLDINNLIKAEKAGGRAKYVLYFPERMVIAGFYCINLMFGKSNTTYLVLKALWPFRTV